MDLNGTRRAAACAALGGVLALALAACGSSGDQVGARGGDTGAAAAPVNTGPPAGVGNGNGNGSTKDVSYRGVEFTVPADWPVYDLEADPSTCVRFDVHAVYLGHPSPDMQCPAVVVGRDDALLVEPLEGSAAAENGAANASEAGQVNGLSVATDRSAVVEHELRATFGDQGVAVTISFADEKQADQILGSFKAKSR
jgi:hypothetical protein